MLNFSVPDMSCGGCAQAITRAVQKLDPQAIITPDLAAKQVAIETSLQAGIVRETLEKAGFPVTER